MVSLENFDSINTRQVFFEQTITRLVNYWLEHEAIQGVDVGVLNEEQENISKTIHLALDMPSVWVRTRDLMQAFSNYLERYGHRELWESLSKKAIETAKRENDTNAQAGLHNALARLFVLQGKLLEAVQCSREASHLAKVSGNRYEEAMAYSYLGFCFVEIGHLWRAEVFCCRALNIFEQLESQHGLALTHQNLACLYIEQDKFQASEQHFKIACQLWEQLDDDFYLLFAYNNLGRLYHEQEQYDQAILFLHKARDKGSILKDSLLISIVEQNLARSYRSQGSLDLAQQYLKRAEPIIQKSGDAVALAVLMHDLADISKDKKDFVPAAKYFNLAAEQFAELKIFRTVATSRLSQAECQMHLEEYDNCVRTLRQAEKVFIKLTSDQQGALRSKTKMLYTTLKEQGILSSSSQ